MGLPLSIDIKVNVRVRDSAGNTKFRDKGFVLDSTSFKEKFSPTIELPNNSIDTPINFQGVEECKGLYLICDEQYGVKLIPPGGDPTGAFRYTIPANEPLFFPATLGQIFLTNLSGSTAQFETLGYGIDTIGAPLPIPSIPVDTRLTSTGQMRFDADGTDNNTNSELRFDLADKRWYNIIQPQGTNQDLDTHYGFTLPTWFIGFQSNAFEYVGKLSAAPSANARVSLKGIYDTNGDFQTTDLPADIVASIKTARTLAATSGAIAGGTYSPGGEVLVVFQGAGDSGDESFIGNRCAFNLTPP